MIQEKYNSIIPTNLFRGDHNQSVDLEAIAFFAATGFFFENDTYWENSKWSELDFNKQPWRYEPRNISLDEAVEEFASLFHKIVEEQTQDEKIILPLSGGLDSRSLAVALNYLNKQPFSYSYEFEGSFKETQYGEQIAKKLGWEFKKYVIPPGYLWKNLEDAGKLNGCYSEFTHARQIAVAREISAKGDVWLLGHWGDVLFDDMGVQSNMPVADQKAILFKKVLKKGGIELATDLWQAWGLNGEFSTALESRIDKMFSRIEIENANARIRAFKSLYWATRWTSTNLVYFSHHKPMSLPYYDDRMCRFIMTIPEELLAKRQIQIEYIKKYSPELAKIPWQDKVPYNLHNYHKHLTVQHYPYLIKNKIKRSFKQHLLGKKLVQRNWEIQFLGEENDLNLKYWLFENEAFMKLVSRKVTEKYYQLFKSGNQVYWSHPLSMLLTLSVFATNNAGNFKK